MKDPGFSVPKSGFALKSNVRSNFTPKKILALTTATVCLIGLMFGIGIFASYFERSIRSKDELVRASTAFNKNTGYGSHLGLRDDREEGFVAVESSVPAVVDRAAAGSMDTAPSPTEFEEGVRIPISTQTLYSISKVDETTTQASTIKQFSVALSSSSEDPGCGAAVLTETHTSHITVTVSPTSSFSAGYATVTGEPSTFTSVDPNTAYTSGPSVVTVSGTRSTLTNVQIDVSYTSGLPDVTISGNSSTVMNAQTDVSVTKGLPDAISDTLSTVTKVGASYSAITQHGSPTVTVVITDLWGTKTKTTIKTTPVVVINSDLYSPAVESRSSGVYYTSAAEDEGITRSWGATVPPYPTNDTIILGPSGTVTAVPGPTTPVVASGATKKPEPRGFGGSNGSSSIGCTVMIIAAIMFML